MDSIWYLLYLENIDEISRINIDSVYGPLLEGESKLDKWFDKHRIIKAILPYAIGISVGLFPFITCIVLFKLLKT